jgi:DNA modification methylase
VTEVVTIGDATLYCGDALDVLESLSIDPPVVITDPPYSSGGFNEAGKGSGSIGTTTKGASIAGDTMSSEGYVSLVRRVLRATRGNAAYVFTDWRMWGHTREAIELAGFRVRGMLVWDKGSAGLGIRWKMQHELIAWGSRVTSKIGAGHGNVISIPRSGNVFHPTEKPIELMRALAMNAEDGVILDPFMGSGTTGVAAASARREFVGIELDRRHFDIACERIERAQAQGQMFPPEQVKQVQEALI